MSRSLMLKASTALALGLMGLVSTPAWADADAVCNDSGVGGTECGTDSSAADFATAVGNTATASGEGSVAVGSSATAEGLVAVAIGNAAFAPADNATAIGFLAQGTGVGSTATGAGAIAEGENSVASGINAAANGVGSVAIGANSSATGADSVALGSGSIADQDNTVSVGTVGGERRIVNVAAGIDATDAVNVGQLTGVTDQFNSQIAGVNAALGTETAARIAGDAALGAQLDDLAGDFRRGAREARAGSAAALAAAGLPQAVDAGRTMISGGLGTYRGRAALAIGASHRASNGQSVFKLGVTYDSSEHVGANAGVGFQF